MKQARLITAEQAARLVKNGDVLMAGGFGMTGNPVHRYRGSHSRRCMRWPSAVPRKENDVEDVTARGVARAMLRCSSNGATRSNDTRASSR